MAAAHSIQWLFLLGVLFSVTGISILGAGFWFLDYKYRELALAHGVPPVAIGLLLELIALLTR